MNGASPVATAERRLYFAMTSALALAVALGFSRTFFLRHWFPEWTAAHAPREPYFFFHGALFALWFLLLMAQSSLVSVRRVDLRRRFGWFGAVLGTVMIPAGIAAALIAARRPTGFIDVPLPPLQFLLGGVLSMAAFGTFVALAVATRRDPQQHKRYMLLGSISLVGAAVVRWPFAIVAAELPGGFYGVADLFASLFLAPLVLWDLYSGRRVHPVTLKGGVVLIALPVFSRLLGDNPLWLAIAGWAVGLSDH